jgi:hypothetical protein
MKSRFPKRLHKKAKRGFKGYPVGTIAFYGPDNRFASKGGRRHDPGRERGSCGS